jgi:V8-like Glu-specific endopeptidase
MDDSIFVERFVSLFEEVCNAGEKLSGPDLENFALYNAVAKVGSATGFLVGPPGATSSRYILTNQHVTAELADYGCRNSNGEPSGGPESEDIYFGSPTQKCSGVKAYEKNIIKTVLGQRWIQNRNGVNISVPWLMPFSPELPGENKTLFTMKKTFHQGDMAFRKGLCPGGLTVDFGHYERGGSPTGSPQQIPDVFSQTPEPTYCAKILISNQEYDFAILELDEEPKYRNGKYIRPFELSTQVPRIGSHGIVVGHPGASFKKIAITNHQSGDDWNGTTDVLNMKYACKISLSRHEYDGDEKLRDYAIRAEDPALRLRYPHTLLHDCDTMGGSSGSPVLVREDQCMRGPNDMKVMGLHWNGWTVSKGQYYKSLADGGVIRDITECPPEDRSCKYKIEYGHDVFQTMPFQENNSMILISEIKDHLSDKDRFATKDISLKLKKFFGKDGAILANHVNDICHEGSSYMDDLGNKIGEVIASKNVCKFIKTFSCAKDASKLTSSDFKDFTSIDKTPNVCGCEPKNIIWDRGPVDCELAGGDYCQKNPHDLKCDRLRANCESRMRNIPDLREKARDLINEFHMCYTGKTELDNIKEIFQIQD